MAPKLPIVNLGGPYTGAVDQPLVIDLSGCQPSPGAVLRSGSLLWGDGQTHSWTGKPPATLAHTYTAAKTYTLVCTILDSKGRSMTGSITASIVVMPPTPLPPPPTTPPPPPVTIPEIPVNLVATPGDTVVTLSCSPAARATSYLFKRGTVSGGPYTILSPEVESPAFTDTGRTNGVTYYYVVAAKNSAGTSANSVQVSAVPVSAVPTAPTPPSNLTASAEGNAIRLQWGDNSSNETAFEIERKLAADANFTALATVAAGVITYLDQTANATLSYQYRVRAMNGATPSAYSNVATFTPVVVQPVTRLVFAGGDLQAVVNAANPGDTIKCQAGAEFVLDLKLPNKPGSSYITITTMADPGNLPPAGIRTGPQYAAFLPKIRAAGNINGTAIETADASHHWRLEHLEVLPALGGQTASTHIVTLGDYDGAQFSTQNTLAAQPHHLIVDRCYIHDPVGGRARNGLLLNANDLVITNNYVDDIRKVGDEVHGLVCYSAEGRHFIDNNYIAASTIGVLYGGASPLVAGQIPADVTFTNNTVTKKLSWWTLHPTYAGTEWSVKCGFELKNAQRFRIERNIIEYAWLQSQVGYLVLFTALNQEDTAPYTTVKDITFQYNVVRHGGGGLNCTSHNDVSNVPATPSRDVMIRHNLLYDISRVYSPNLGRPFLVAADWTNLTIDHNTCDGDGTPLMALAEFANGAYQTSVNTVFTNNILGVAADYVVHGSSDGTNGQAMATYWPGSTILKNRFGATLAQSPFPATNEVVGSAAFAAAFVDRANANYRLVTGHPWKGAATDGADIGVNMDLLPIATEVPSTGVAFHVKTTGLDSNDGLTEATAFRTIRRGLSAMVGGRGDVCYVHTGTYAENITADVVPAGTAWSNAGTLRPYGTDTVTIGNGGRVDINTSVPKYFIFRDLLFEGGRGVSLLRDTGNGIPGETRIRFQGCDLQHQDFPVGDDGVPFFIFASYNEFINCSVHDTVTPASNRTHGFYIQGAFNLVDGCHVYNMTGYGVQIYNGYNYTAAHDNTVRNCRIHDNGGSSNPGGIILSKGENNHAYNNVIWNEAAFGGHGIDVDYSANNSTVYNNTLYNCTIGIQIGGNDASITGVLVKNNIVFGSTVAPIDDHGVGTVRSNNLEGTNPLFINIAGENFQVQEGSPAINTGATLVDVPTDLLGVTRPQRGAYDIGAYEKV